MRPMACNEICAANDLQEGDFEPGHQRINQHKMRGFQPASFALGSV